MEEGLPQAHDRPRSSAQQVNIQWMEPFPLPRCGPQSTLGRASCFSTQPDSRGRRPSPVRTQPDQPSGQPNSGERDLVARVDLPALLQRLQRAQAGRAHAPAEPSREPGCSFSAASMQVRFPARAAWEAGVRKSPIKCPDAVALQSCDWRTR